MEIETAARRHFLGLPTVHTLTGNRVYKFELEESIDRTGLRALVFRRSNGWATPDPVQTSEYPLLYVDCWADPSRDEAGNAVANDAIGNAFSLFRAVDPHIHRLRDQWWGAGGDNPGLRILSAQRWGEPTVVLEKDRHGGGASAGGSAVATPSGECAIVTVPYALHVVH